ncbi:testis-expressed protein 13D-like, partial [Crocuta crocuta]
NEVEDRLQAVLADPQVSHAIKRACTWSALALSVRVGARQREQQGHRVQRLQDEVDERETAAWALASELQRLRVECKELAAQFQCSWASLQQVLDELNVLRGRVLREKKMTSAADQSCQEVMSESGAEQCGATGWPVDVEEQGKMIAIGAQAAPGSEVQVAAPAAGHYVQAPWSSWAQTLQPSLPVQVSQPFPFHASFPVGFPYSTSPSLSAVVEADPVAAITAQMPRMGIYPPGIWAAVGAQEQMAPLCDQRCWDQGGNSGTLQGGYPLGDSRSHSQEEDPVCPQVSTYLEDIRNHSQKEDLERSQWRAPFGDRSSNQKECPLIAQEKYPLENSKRHSQEGPEMPQEISPLGSSGSSTVRRSPSKQQPEKQKAKHQKGGKASDSQHQGKPASQCSPKNWDCLS